MKRSTCLPRSRQTSRVSSEREQAQPNGEKVKDVTNQQVDKRAIRIRAGVNSVRRLESGEEKRLLEYAEPHLHALIVAALETGCRLGELLSLQWPQVRWMENVVLLPTVKTSEVRDVPITSRLRELLEMRRQRTDGRELGPEAYVFGNRVGERIQTITTAWRAACRRAKITDLHFHDLRREFASRLLESGASDDEKRERLGHANIPATSFDAEKKSSS